MTHLFHPQSCPDFDFDFDFVKHRQNRGEDQVHLHDENSGLFCLPGGWTEVAPAGPYVVIAEGCCRFTIDGLLALADLIGPLRSQTRSAGPSMTRSVIVVMAFLETSGHQGPGERAGVVGCRQCRSVLEWHMACTLHVAWDDRLTRYDFGSWHPMAPVRVEMTMELARAFGVFSAAGVSVEPPALAADGHLEMVHLQRYIAAVRQAGDPEPDPSVLDFGLGTEDNPVFAGMHNASALVAGATLAAARKVWAGEAWHGASIAGGLHHAMRASASGFCVYNDPAIAISWLLAAGASPAAYIDIDVHHGDGVQAAFYDDPRVLTISLHEHPATLWPGTGWPSETGGPGAQGSAVNVALPAGTGDAGWLRAFDAVVPLLLRAFRPDIVVSQHGCDTHRLDPLANLQLSIDAQRIAHAAIHQLVHEVAGGRWVLTGGGGYELLEVVPRTWTHLLAEAAGCPIDPGARIPATLREYAFRRTGREAPQTMTDGTEPEFARFESGYDLADPVDQAIMATRRAVFPEHGLMPEH